MDAIRILKDDHKTVEQLFKKFERAGDRAHAQKRQIVDRIIEELSTHAAIEEQFFYPVARATVPRAENVALESLEEHHIVKWVLSELETMAPDAERFDAKVTVLIENVRHHVKEEEKDFFPKVRKELDRAALNDLGELMSAAKKAAPTHPHPRSPDTPPGNLIVGTAAGVADRVTDTVSGLAQGSVTAVGDVIATILGRRKPRVSARGSKVARRTAAQVRDTGSDATEAVIEAARRAKDAAPRSSRRSASTGRTAKAATKRTASTARKASAARTSTSPRKATKRAATATRRAANKAGKSTASTAKRATRKTASTAKRSVRRT